MNRSLRMALIAVGTFQLALATNVHAQNAVVSEYALKAAYLYHFVQFTEWPEATLQPLEAFTICIAKNNPLRPMVAELAGQLAHGKPIAIRIPENDAGNCQVALLGAEDWQRGAMTNDQRLPMLTIAEEPPLSARAVITLGMEERRVGFSIDKTLAEECGLQISSKLLRLARSVK